MRLSGSFLRELRVMLGVSVKELSAKLNISANYVYTIERGEKEASPKLLQRYSEIFSIDEDTLAALSKAYQEDPSLFRSRVRASMQEHACEKTACGNQTMSAERAKELLARFIRHELEDASLEYVRELLTDILGMTMAEIAELGFSGIFPEAETCDKTE